MGCKFQDVRHGKRMGQLLDQLSGSVGATTPRACQDWANTKAEERGYPPYHPQMMTKVLIYGYSVGVFSSRRLEKRLVEDIDSRVLAASNEPEIRTIAEFRRIHLKALEGLFEQVLRLALKLDAMRLGRMAIDGSKVKANASKHKAMSYRRIE